ncbi:hypothetical protein Cgig2_017568 [Carnegiea gigantea]|uniref:Histone-lysine N-methyltransferase ASHH1 n=1 Tax=Carnegiea gigantea TaxID=171969 RepID=A0A9Q1KKE5_9CARY|nr:hypothetical protein Cgig2_017568 [Carnegiea gigantea]
MSSLTEEAIHDFLRHKKQKDEDVAICECKYDPEDPESACGDGCLNVLTSTECTPGYCPCGELCKNQKFQKYEYAKTKLFKTDGRGWGLLADEEIKAGQFIIEYCGEVISWKEAKRRAQAYETQGLKDAYIISLNAHESIDATRKGSLARFINHSCQPNCETRKWTVQGEIRVGIFAKHDISIGTELAYDYNFEWYGGAKVRCLCGAASCSGFLGAKSRGFQQASGMRLPWFKKAFLGEMRQEASTSERLRRGEYSVEKIPLYDSAEDEPSTQAFTSANFSTLQFGVENNNYSVIMDVDRASGHKMDSTPMDIEPLDSVRPNGDARDAVNSDIVVSKKKLKRLPKGKLKNLHQKEFDHKDAVAFLASKEAQEEILTFEEIRKDASSNLESLYDEIRPAIEEHEKDTQDSVPTSVAEKWIEASCLKMKTEFDLYFSVVKNLMLTPKKSGNIKHPNGEPDDGVKLLTND